MTMRAKFRVSKVEFVGVNPTTEAISMMAVSEKPFDSEDNSFAKWTPSGELKISISNPNLHGKIKEGQKYYLDFSEAAT